MTKQEKIREGIAKILHTEDNPFPFEPTWEEEEERDYWYEYADKVVSYLHSQDVVRKTDDLPIFTKKGTYHIVEPLIKEVPNG